MLLVFCPGHELRIMIASYSFKWLEKIKRRIFPGGPVVKNLPVEAGDNVFNPWSQETLRAVGQLSLRATTAEALES